MEMFPLPFPTLAVFIETVALVLATFLSLSSHQARADFLSNDFLDGIGESLISLIGDTEL